MNKSIALIGATGMVGMELLKYLPQLNNIKLTLFASEKSKGTIIKFKNKDLIVKTIKFDELDNFDYIFNASSGELAEEISKHITNKTILIDNSSFFRMHYDFPLIIPEINIDLIKHHHIIANPNCSTIILCMALNAIHQKYKINNINVSTYQASSGAGKNGYQELQQQAKNWCNQEQISIDYWNKQYIWNIFSHNSDIDLESGYNGEEIKMMKETQKILGDIDISVTCVRVPTLRSHCESVSIILENETDINSLRKIIADSDGVQLLDDRINNIFPETLTSHQKTDVYVGRIRKDLAWDKKYKNKAWKLFISGDQLAKGAAYNAYQILKHCIN